MKIIFNADDFGMTNGVNRGILDCHRFGTLFSTTLLANGLAFEEAVSISKRAPNLGVGVHLNITTGKPLASPESVSSLINGEGVFYSQRRKVVRNIDEIEIEFEMQIKKIKAAGIKISHLDSHHHIHLRPEIIDLSISLARKYNLPMRMKMRGEVVSVDNLGFTSGTVTLENLQKDILECLSRGFEFVEYCSHPTIVDIDYLKITGWVLPRINDYAVLTCPDFLQFLNEQRILSTNYNNPDLRRHYFNKQ